MNDGDRKGIAAAILEHEHVGDKIVHDIIRRLNKSFITPIDREDIYDLVATTDEILDNIEAAADMVLLYRVDEITEQARRQAEVIAKATPAAQGVHGQPREAQGPRRAHHRHQQPRERRRPHPARRHRRACSTATWKCTDIIKWKDIYEILEAAIDECEHVANVIESIVLKHN